MKRVLITIALGVFLGGVLQAQAPAGPPPDEWTAAMAAGDKAFGEGKFDEAAKQFLLARNRADRLDRLVMSYYVLGQVARARDNYSEAERLYKVAIGIIEKDLGAGYGKQKAFLMMHLSETLKAAGKLQESQEWAQKAEEQTRQAQAATPAGGQPPAADITARGPAPAPPVAPQLPPQEGPVTCLDIPAIQFAAGVPDSAELAARLDGLGGACLAGKKFAQAEDFYRRAVAVRAAVAGADSPLLGTALLGLARAQQGRGNLPGADRAATRAVVILDKAGRGKDPVLLQSLQVSAQALEAQGRRKEAQAALRRLMAVQEQAGRPAAEIIAAIADLAASLQADGNARDAQAELRRGLEIADRAGAKPDAARVGALLAQSLVAEGNQKEAARLVQSAAQAGAAEAQAALGAALERDGDYRGALSWYRKAGEQGNVQGELGAASIYERGLGLPSDIPEALVEFASRWYRKAAEQGDATGQYKVGAFYEQGRGTLKNPVEALAWYILAAGRNTEAKARVEDLAKKLPPADVEAAHKRAQDISANPSAATN